MCSAWHLRGQPLPCPSLVAVLHLHRGPVAFTPTHYPSPTTHRPLPARLPSVLTTDDDAIGVHCLPGAHPY